MTSSNILISKDASSAKEAQQSIYAELVNLLYRQIRMILVVENIAALLIVIGLFHTTSTPLLIGWYLYNLFGSAVWRSILAYRFRHRASDDQRTTYWLNWFWLGSSMSALSWSLLGVMLLPLQDFTLQAFLIIFLFGVAAASNAIYSPIKKVYFSFLLIELLPLTVWLFWQADLLYMLLAGAILLFICCMLITSSHAYQLLENSLRLRFENHELHETKQLLEMLNEDLYKEIRRRKKTEEMLEFMSTHDVLTGLANRTLFHKKLESAFALAIEKHHSVAILFIDLDNFKKINDTLGHDIGDKLLAHVGNIIKSHIRETDTIARSSGDEFTVIIESIVDREAISIIAQKICNALAEKMEIEGNTVQMSASIGISLFPDNGQDLFTLIKNADIALYHAKKLGKKTYQIYTDSMSEMISHQKQLEDKLYKAIENNEFKLLYQPIVDLNTNKPIAVEALIRWQTEHSGLIPPAYFISSAEELGLIIPIGEWVLEESCRRFKEWQAKGLSLEYISVNVSPKQFLDPDFLNKINRVLDDTGLEGQYLNLEITESLFVQDEELVLTILKDLKTKGIRVGLDDFGTGYSSLNYLKKFPIDIIKIDRSFIKDTPANDKNTAITKAIVNLANSLHLDIIAEGIETKEQNDFLKSIRAKAGQGYFIHLPLDLAQMEALLTTIKEL